MKSMIICSIHTQLVVSQLSKHVVQQMKFVLLYPLLILPSSMNRLNVVRLNKHSQHKLSNYLTSQNTRKLSQLIRIKLPSDLNLFIQRTSLIKTLLYPKARFFITFHKQFVPDKTSLLCDIDHLTQPDPPLFLHEYSLFGDPRQVA